MIVVVGSINMDLVVRVQRHPRPGETVLGGDYARHFGGKGANQAVAAARLEVPVRMVGAVGNDLFGPQLIERTGAEGIDGRWLRTEDAPSGVAFISVDDAGENCIIVAPGANSRVTPESIDPTAFEGAAAVLMQLEIPLDTVLSAAKLARAAGVKTVLNAAPAIDLGAAQLRDFDVLLVNEVEAGALLGQKGPSSVAEARHQAAELSAFGGGLAVVVTLGENGAVFKSAGQSGHIPACKIDAVDTTAAGDAFAGAFAAALSRGAATPEAVSYGCAAGAYAATRAGAQSSLPTRKELDDWVRSRREAK